MKKINYKTISILLVTGYSLLVTLNVANAAGLVPCSGSDCTICSLFVGVKNIVNFLTVDIAMPLAVVILIYGGVMLLTSGESETRREKGKKALWHAVWGLLIVFAAWLIIDTILGNLVDPGYLPWNQFPGC